MSEFRCAIKEAGRVGARRCQNQCASCLQQFLKRDDGRPVATCETAGGNYFDYADPRPEQITIDDVAGHLSLIARFAGATTDLGNGRPVTYSVAEHALHVSHIVANVLKRPDLALPALHHDSHEYMLGDWPTPLKRQIRAAGVTILDDLVAKTNVAIGERFGVDPDLFKHPTVKEADMLALYREAATFKASRGVGHHWGRTEVASPIAHHFREPWLIKEEFIIRHEDLGGK